MAHSSDLRWEQAANQVSARAAQTLAELREAEEVYQELLEAYNFAGGTDQLFADQLFVNEILARSETTANAEEVSKVTDLRLAITALHQLYQCLTNVAVTQADRATNLRRMS